LKAGLAFGGGALALIGAGNSLELPPQSWPSRRSATAPARRCPWRLLTAPVVLPCWPSAMPRKTRILLLALVAIFLLAMLE
jgi:hypothetical protein